MNTIFGFDENKAKISEIFMSYQGEGIFIGEPQIFVRFYGCNISCNYCDTRKKYYKIYSVNKLIKKIRVCVKNNITKFPDNRNPTVVLTGGEPLLWIKYLKGFLPALKQMNVKIMLETNGTLPADFKSISKFIDIVSMDLKLPSACNDNFWKEHELFLRYCSNKVYLKTVATSNTGSAEILKAVNLAGSVSKQIPFILQPVSEINGLKSPEEETLRKYLTLARKKLDKVFLIPQLHKIWKIA